MSKGHDSLRALTTPYGPLRQFTGPYGLSANWRRRSKAFSDFTGAFASTGTQLPPVAILRKSRPGWGARAVEYA
jgi:hypothetical protein